MDTPAPVNLNALKGILANAKKVMNKIEGDKPINQKSNQKGLSESAVSSGPIYDEADEREPEYVNAPAPQNDIHEVRDYTAEQVMASKLPDVIKQAMLKNPIPRLSGPPAKFTLEDVSDLVEKPIAKQTRRPLQESSKQSDMIMISPSQLQSMIQEGINAYFKDNYDKRITEEAIKKTINVLIKEGKVNIKKK